MIHPDTRRLILGASFLLLLITLSLLWASPEPVRLPQAYLLP